jgi:hypothetical protein
VKEVLPIMENVLGQKIKLLPTKLKLHPDSYRDAVYTHRYSKEKKNRKSTIYTPANAISQQSKALCKEIGVFMFIAISSLHLSTNYPL